MQIAAGQTTSVAFTHVQTYYETYLEGGRRGEREGDKRRREERSPIDLRVSLTTILILYFTFSEKVPPVFLWLIPTDHSP